MIIRAEKTSIFTLKDMAIRVSVACFTMLIQQKPPSRRFTALPAAAVNC
ncbi:MAG: hypothetical protein ACJASB_002807 [Shewanella psychromarinicola]|jgi:hypothetical protein